MLASSAPSTSETASSLAAISAQEIELGTMDLAEFGITVDGLYLYRSSNNDADFMALDMLQRSFYQLVADHYPIVVGRPGVNSAGKAVIAVDPSNLCMPDFAEIKVPHPATAFLTTRPGATPVRFFDLRRFYRDSGVDRLPRATYHQDHAAAIVRVLRFSDNYVALAYSMSHVLFDGTGTIMFMNHWAEYTRAMRAGTAVRLTHQPENSRAELQKYLDGVEPVEPPFIAHFKAMMPAEPMPKLPHIAPVLMASPDVPSCEEQHLLHFTPAGLERMRQDMGGALTINLALMALFTKALVHANTQTFGTPPQVAYAVVPYDGRLRADIPAHFAGNISCTAIAPLPVQTVQKASYSELALAIKEHCALVDSGHTKAVMQTIETDLPVLYHASFSLCNAPQTTYFGLSNVRYMPFATIDFGFGSPEILSFDYFVKEGMARMYPNLQDGGVDMILNYPDANFAKLRQHEDLAKYADFIF
ncbi:hypothetical protein GGI04_005142 [Coemansia thaxteri]|uniref:Uncharacterized protein n=1 Tax=Coemansia thaxteri TaxID=2663907 RepID=A0A9W8BM31_9FUNG|nr:hypothetical protein GGI04_005142 [Coemansia thaxteri]KAJ2006474.1 hypothetical protein H4R26_001351 [Coemansia thaxteri]KAJ2468971.1 hypothetical protein GGI02_003533 [Coemansia sp. RSA 2322]KAJ2484213.1 hypothetical protein EV174_002614 [Coemansia sp. RSA 2320]